jgi:hypothetical protein
VSNAYDTPTIADGIITAINAAWVGGGKPFSAIEIQEDTEPKTIQDLPFVNLVALEVISDPKGPNASVVSVDDLYRYEIILYFAMPAAQGTMAGIPARLKSQYASLLRAQLQTSQAFAGVANLPYVTKVDYKNRNPRFEGAEMLRVIFECHGESNYFPT